MPGVIPAFFVNGVESIPPQPIMLYTADEDYNRTFLWQRRHAHSTLLPPQDRLEEPLYENRKLFRQKKVCKLLRLLNRNSKRKLL
jgi:hypothetical protein